MQFGRAVLLDEFVLVEVPVDDRVVAMLAGMNFVTREDREASRKRISRQEIEMPGPQSFQPGEAFHVKPDDVSDARIIHRHVRPVGVARHRYEVELPPRSRQRVFEPAVTVGQAAMIMDVSVIGAIPKTGGERRQTFRKRCGWHRHLEYNRYILYLDADGRRWQSDSISSRPK